MKKLFYLSLALKEWNSLSLTPKQPFPYKTNIDFSSFTSFGFLEVFETAEKAEKEYPEYGYIVVSIEVNEPKETLN